MGGDLASLKTIDEIYWIRGYRGYHKTVRPESLWRRGYRENNEWVWKGKLVDTSIGIRDWAGNEPHDNPLEKCMAIFGDDNEWPTSWYRWLNVKCDVTLGYICEKNMRLNKT